MSIEVARVSKKFGAFPALDDVSLKLETGELVALLGPSGSGKTTLLRLIGGLEQQESGRIFFDGADAANISIRERQAGFVFQHYALFRHMSVLKNVAFGLSVRPRAKRPPKAEIERRARELLKLVQLEGVERRLPAQLSGGQRQRVALARALAIEPRVLLLDEPFGALDAKVRKELRRWLRKLHDTLRITTVFVTHDQEEALEIADRVVVMNQGRIEQIGAPREVYDHPASAFVCRFIGNVNEVGAAFIRPHDVEITSRRNGAPSLDAVVEFVNTAGAVAKMDLRLEGSGELLEAELPRSREAELALKPGDRAFVKFRDVRTFPS